MKLSRNKNLDVNVVKDFGSEWSRFDQSILSAADQAEIFEDYFHIFPIPTEASPYSRPLYAIAVLS